MAGKIALVLALVAASASAFAPVTSRPVRVAPLAGGAENELRTRIKSVGNTQKITTAMRLVAAAKVRRAQQGESAPCHLLPGLSALLQYRSKTV
jgi:F-type H+-transporting ATPase subunit gamma